MGGSLLRACAWPVEGGWSGEVKAGMGGTNVRELWEGRLEGAGLDSVLWEAPEGLV